ncbi:MAG: hypothetical protein IPJ82_07120 [Lewinellaceae bacterium]|nr:hypothetical protein [Lewinellaceae bacterium]
MKNIFDWIDPGFMSRVDDYLIEHWPVVWCTKAHYIIFYSLCGALLLFTLGFIIPIINVIAGNVPAEFHLEGVNYASYIFFMMTIAFICGYVRFNPENLFLKPAYTALNLLIYLFCIVIFMVITEPAFRFGMYTSGSLLLQKEATPEFQLLIPFSDQIHSILFLYALSLLNYLPYSYFNKNRIDNSLQSIMIIMIPSLLTLMIFAAFKIDSTRSVNNDLICLIVPALFVGYMAYLACQKKYSDIIEGIIYGIFIMLVFIPFVSMAEWITREKTDKVLFSRVELTGLITIGLASAFLSPYVQILPRNK